MKEEKVYFFKTPPTAAAPQVAAEQAQLQQELSASGTCTEAETFALRVLDESMQPEFRKGCIIIIDPTGHATDGAYVLARQTDGPAEDVESYIFRQLRQLRQFPQTADEPVQWQLAPLNDSYPEQSTPADLSSIVGVIVQRAGIRRRYHKHYY